MPRSELIVSSGEQGLPGLVAALDFGETSGDALDLTLMHNASRSHSSGCRVQGVGCGVKV